MADEIDQATEVADLHLEAALENAKLQATRPTTGLCLNCSEPVSKGSFCDDGGDCREDYMKREAFRR